MSKLGKPVGLYHQGALAIVWGPEEGASQTLCWTETGQGSCAVASDDINTSVSSLQNNICYIIWLFAMFL